MPARRRSRSSACSVHRCPMQRAVAEGERHLVIPDQFLPADGIGTRRDDAARYPDQDAAQYPDQADYDNQTSATHCGQYARAAAQHERRAGPGELSRIRRTLRKRPVRVLPPPAFLCAVQCLGRRSVKRGALRRCLKALDVGITRARLRVAPRRTSRARPTRAESLGRQFRGAELAAPTGLPARSDVPAFHDRSPLPLRAANTRVVVNNRMFSLVFSRPGPLIRPKAMELP
jgi:hypothetical protein